VGTADAPLDVFQENERLRKERDEARDAARWLGELRPLGIQDGADDKRTILERWPWLVEENDKSR
jgi:hypothetical protein